MQYLSAGIIALALALAGLGSTTSEAHAQGQNGRIVGRVTDAEGQPVSGARVTINRLSCAPCLDGNAGEQTDTNGEGEYAFVNVPPGTYEVRVVSQKSRTLLFWRRRDVSLILDAVARADAVVEPVRVQVILRTYRPDGRIDGTALTQGVLPNGFVSADPLLCEPVARLPEGAGATPSAGWSVSGSVLNASRDALTIRVRWQRVWDQGARQSTPRTGTLEARVQLGERFPLDLVTLTPSKSCPVSAARLEVTVTPPATTVKNDERAEALRAQLVAKRTGGRVSEPPAGSGDLNGAVPSSLDDRTAMALQMMESRRAMRPEQIAPGPLFDAELWLVHRLPDGAERSELIRQPVRDTGSFVFPAIHLTSATGTVDLEVFGFVRRVAAEGGRSSLQVAIGQRHVGGAASEAYNGSGKTIPWPDPTEVVSFELPRDDRLPPGHRFDLRLRLRPR